MAARRRQIHTIVGTPDLNQTLGAAADGANGLVQRRALALGSAGRAEGARHRQRPIVSPGTTFRQLAGVKDLRLQWQHSIMRPNSRQSNGTRVALPLPSQRLRPNVHSREALAWHT